MAAIDPAALAATLTAAGLPAAAVGGAVITGGPLTIDLSDVVLPLYCGPLGNVARGGDMNVDWTCQRARRIYSLHTLLEDTARTASRIAVHERAGRTRKAEGLRRWVATVGADRLVFVAEQLDQLGDCEHDEGDRAELTLAEALPPCTC